MEELLKSWSQKAVSLSVYLYICLSGWLAGLKADLEGHGSGARHDVQGR